MLHGPCIIESLVLMRNTGDVVTLHGHKREHHEAVKGLSKQQPLEGESLGVNREKSYRSLWVMGVYWHHLDPVFQPCQLCQVSSSECASGLETAGHPACALSHARGPKLVRLMGVSPRSGEAGVSYSGARTTRRRKSQSPEDD